MFVVVGSGSLTALRGYKCGKFVVSVFLYVSVNGFSNNFSSSYLSLLFIDFMVEAHVIAFLSAVVAVVTPWVP